MIKMSISCYIKPSLSLNKLNLNRPSDFPLSSPPSISLYPTTINTPKTFNNKISLSISHSPTHLFSLSSGNNNGNNNNNNNGDNNNNNNNDDNNNNDNEALLLVGKMRREMESLPKDLAGAILNGKIPKSVVERYFEMEKSGIMRWFLQFAGLRERLLADDLFFTKVFIECGVGMFTKTAAEYQKRKENFFNELEVVCADVVMAVIADFMLVYLPAPTVGLRSPLNVNAGSFAKFFYSCPDNAFQVALGGASYSFIQRCGAVVRNGTKLFAVGTASSLVGTAVTNTFINAKKAVAGAEEVENLPVLATSVAYGVYMSVSSNLRYQLLAGVIEQRLLEPVLHQHKLLLSAVCFAVRTGNTFLGSLLWVDYARLIGLQKPHEVDSTPSIASTA